MINTLKPDFIFCVNEDVCTHAHPHLGIKTTTNISVMCTKIQIITSHCKGKHTTENITNRNIIDYFVIYAKQRKSKNIKIYKKIAVFWKRNVLLLLLCSKHLETNKSSLRESDLDAVRQVINIEVSTYYSIPPQTEITVLIPWMNTTYINLITNNWIPKIPHFHSVAFLKTPVL